MAESLTPLSQPDRFSRPIPGQGLTDPPGAHPWQKPPMFVDLDQALNFVWQRMSQPANVGQVLALLAHGELSAQDVADVILMQGFVNGQWTVTLGLLMAKPVWQMVVAIAHKSGIKFISKTKKPDPLVKLMTDMELSNKSGMQDLLQSPQGDQDTPPQDQSGQSQMPSDAPQTQGFAGMGMAGAQ